MSKPFLKWAGGKYKLTPTINSLLPAGERLIEPFVGSGAVFLNAKFDSFLLADINEDLIDLYNCLKNEYDFIEYSYELFKDNIYNNKDEYYRLRDLFNKLKREVKIFKELNIKETSLENTELLNSKIKEKSRIFLYLNRHGFNGLCRYNSAGGFNVPFGKYTKPYFPKKEMEFFHNKAQTATFIAVNFASLFNSIELASGDVVYCDPPYAPLEHQKTNFTTYSGNSFLEKEQIELVNVIKKLQKQGVPTLISNHDTPETRNYYTGAKITEIMVNRTINSNAEGRKQVKEILALFD